MRLWHQDLIKLLPSKKDYKGSTNQLGGQHTEIRMILGSIKKHGKVNHSTVNYVNKYPLYYLHAYGLLVIDEMLSRGFNVSQDIIKEYQSVEGLALYLYSKHNNINIFDEHNDNYLLECINNLHSKGIDVKYEEKKRLLVCQ
jgi:uncharacterized protein (TIGR02328 family)